MAWIGAFGRGDLGSFSAVLNNQLRTGADKGTLFLFSTANFSTVRKALSSYVHPVSEIMLVALTV